MKDKSAQKGMNNAPEGLGLGGAGSVPSIQEALPEGSQWTSLAALNSTGIWGVGETEHSSKNAS